MDWNYVVLHHTGFGEPHFDVLLEVDPESELLSFRAPQWPPGLADRWIERPAHRRVYLSYEGPVSGGRGEVRRVAAGAYRSLDLLAEPVTIGFAFEEAGTTHEIALQHVDSAGDEDVWVVLTLRSTSATG